MSRDKNEEKVQVREDDLLKDTSYIVAYEDLGHRTQETHMRRLDNKELSHQRPKKSQLSGRQNFMRKNFVEEVRRFFRNICLKIV